jgi:hypothetical protein
MRKEGNIIIRVIGVAVAAILSWVAIGILTLIVLATQRVEVRILDFIGDPRPAPYGIIIGERVVDQAAPMFFPLLCVIFAPATAFAVTQSVILWKRWSRKGSPNPASQPIAAKRGSG